MIMRPSPTLITEQSVATFFEQGFLAVPNALADVEELRAETTRICRGDAGDVRGLVPADTNDSEADVLRRYLCIHFPHKISQVMYSYLAHPVIVDVLTKIIGPNVKCMQSMLFIKAA